MRGTPYIELLLHSGRKSQNWAVSDGGMWRQSTPLWIFTVTRNCWDIRVDKREQGAEDSRRTNALLNLLPARQLLRWEASLRCGAGRFASDRHSHMLVLAFCTRQHLKNPTFASFLSVDTRLLCAITFVDTRIEGKWPLSASSARFRHLILVGPCVYLDTVVNRRFESSQHP